MCDFEQLLKALEMEHLRKCFFKQFKVIKMGDDICGFWAKVIFSNSNKEVEALGLDLYEGNHLEKSPSELYDFMISEWRRLNG